MNSNIVEQTRSRLQRRSMQLRETHWRNFHNALKLYCSFIEGDQFLGSLLDELTAAYELNESPEKICDELKFWSPTSELEEARRSFAVIEYCRSEGRGTVERDMANRMHDFSSYGEDYSHQSAFFFDTFVRPLNNYLEERIDEARIVLSLLRRYKHHVEWFRRNELASIVEEEKQRASASGRNSRAEKRLALHLYEFLHSQGVTFSIEPASISGEADLVAAQDSDDPLLADVKIFDPQSGKNKSYLISGFHQVYQYTLDYNEPFGYLVIFKTCEEGLAFSSGQQEQSTSFITFNGKTIFFVVVDVFAHEKSASQRGKLKSYVLTEQELVTKSVDTEQPLTAPSSDEVDSSDEGEVQ